MSDTVPALGRLLVQSQFLSTEELKEWTDRAQSAGTTLDQALVAGGAFSRADLIKYLENHFFCPSTDLADPPFAPEALSLIPRRLAERHHAFAVGLDGDAVKVAFADPDNAKAKDAISMATHRKIIPMVALQGEIEAALAACYDRMLDQAARSEEKLRSEGKTRTEEKAVSAESIQASSNSGVGTLDLRGKDAVIVVDSILEAAERLGSTDIHIQPADEEITVRLRVDGIMRTVSHLRKDIGPSVTSRIKIMSGMDIAESRMPQDGRIKVEKAGHEVNLRVSTLPSKYGEKIVLRLLPKSMDLLNLDNLKMPPPVREAYRAAVEAPLGLFLVTGPTGSGKTTTLYATLNAHDRSSLNIITLEDPVEYTLDGITQVPIKESIGLTFGVGLRTVLRQDPDVVLVGEMRDLETVEIAARAALTGHKVLSTLHTNDSCQAITRLTDMGTPPYLITATLKGVMAQRLMRLLCEHCKESYEANDTERALLGHPKQATLYRGAGCGHCGGTGYKGRSAIFEYFRLEPTMHRLILEGASPFSIRYAAQKNGMILMAEFAKRAVLEGRTTVAEIQRVILSEEGKEQLCKTCQHVVSIEFTVCPFCQSKLHENCPGCSGPIESDWEACPNCGHEIEHEWQKVFCRTCLAPVDPHWSSCQYCGGEIG